MRHFRDVDHMVEALAEEARQQGCAILERNGRTYAVVAIDCECGCSTITDIDLTATAQHIWEALE